MICENLRDQREEKKLPADGADGRRSDPSNEYEDAETSSAWLSIYFFRKEACKKNISKWSAKICVISGEKSFPQMALMAADLIRLMNTKMLKQVQHDFQYTSFGKKPVKRTFQNDLRKSAWSAGERLIPGDSIDYLSRIKKPPARVQKVFLH